MTKEQMLDFIHATGNVSRPGLERIAELLRLLGDPQEKLHFIHVAGTNGKGSLSAMLCSILMSAGYRTGLYISPHLFRVNERMSVNGEEVSDAELCALADEVSAAVEQMDDKPTEFERLTAMGFLHFVKRACDLVVLEVGLGGRLDATNVIGAPEAAAIMNIGLEHTKILGDTIEKIAWEKGGIIKENCPVILYRQSAAVENVIAELCRERGAHLRVAQEAVALESGLDGQRFVCGERGDLYITLLGRHQLGNAAVALGIVDALNEKGSYPVSEEAVRKGLAAAKWPARLEIVHREPLVLLDGAHNPNGVEALSRALGELFPQKKLTLVMGVMADKDYGEMLALIAPHASRLIAASIDYYRALPSDQLKANCALDIPVLDGGNICDALCLALDTCAPDEAICVFGSLYQAGDVRAFFGLE